jgi:hypothetical protein
MATQKKIKWGRLRFMYWYTIIGAGSFGLGIILIPDTMRSIFGWPDQDPIVYGITGSVFLAFGLISVLGLRSPLKFVPILLLQLCYKSIWIVGVILPMLVLGDFPSYGILSLVIFLTYIVGDLLAIPFSYVFTKQSEQQIFDKIFTEAIFK